MSIGWMELLHELGTTMNTGGGAVLLIFVAETALFVLALYCLHRALSEHRRTTEEMRLMVRKTEAITADEREQIVRLYDRFVQRILRRLPDELAETTEEALFRTEELILRRLAELEPNLRHDPQARTRLDDIIRSMETLNDSIIRVNVDAVERALRENRESLRHDLAFSDLPHEVAS
jgi:hypothetical protein